MLAPQRPAAVAGPGQGGAGAGRATPVRMGGTARVAWQAGKARPPRDPASRGRTVLPGARAMVMFGAMTRRAQASNHPGPRAPRMGQPQDALLQRLQAEGHRIPLSFELFPPHGADRRRDLDATVAALAPVATAGFSVTMGAGGTTRQGTHETCTAVAAQSGRPVMAHLTALGLTRAEALAAAEGLWEAGITRILALQGDRPRQGPIPPGFAHASDLVAALAARHPFDLSVAAYPETHPAARTPEADIDYLRQKLEAGARRAYCQFVLDPAAYGRFLDACGRHGIDAPIIPGLMPLEGWARLRGFARANGASVPAWLDRLFAPAEKRPELMPYLAAAATVEQARRLVAYGAPALHVYTMNRWPQALALAHLMGQG